MQKWEYRVADWDELTACGADGWEAVGVIRVWGDGYNVLMKRSIPGESIEVAASTRYGIFLNTGPQSSGWMKDANGYVMSSASRLVMEAQASELDASWGAEVRMLP